MTKRTIAVFTGSRAEYGLLHNVIRGLNENQGINLKLYVGGTHLSQKYGNTQTEIEQDGFQINQKFNFLIFDDSPSGIARATGYAVQMAADAFKKDQPDLLLVLGDRIEVMAVAQAALLSRIPIAHVHGGEVTFGAIDDAIRHCITKMAHLHFTSTETYRQRVIQMGEHPERVFNFGAPGVDNIVGANLLDREHLSARVGLDLESPFFLVTYHPVTLANDGGLSALEALLGALDDYKCHNVLITYPNADTTSEKIIDALQSYKMRNENRVALVKSLGKIGYLSAVKYCSAVIGNSSSGLIEVPSLGKPTVNVGNRQKGRITGATVLNCEDDTDSIKSTIRSSLSEKFLKTCESSENPYGVGGSSNKILDVIINHPIDNLTQKQFFDL